jgi:hypothetical protein
VQIEEEEKDRRKRRTTTLKMRRGNRLHHSLTLSSVNNSGCLMNKGASPN